MNYQKIASKFELMGKLCAIGTGLTLPVSTAATVTLFPLAALFSLASGNWREKFKLLAKNPVAITFVAFFALFLVGVTYSVAPWHDILIILRKYIRFLFAVLILPLFVQQKWRGYAVNAFLGGVLILLASSYLRNYGWFSIWATGVVEVFKSSIEFNFLMAVGAYLVLIKIFSIIGNYRWVWIAIFIAIVYTILFRSMGRSGYFVFAGLMALFFMQKFGWRGVVTVFLSIVVLFSLAFYFSATFKERINLVFDEVKNYQQNNITSVGLRITFVKNSLKIIKKHPFFGSGTGSFASEHALVESREAACFRNPHNEYIHMMVQFGLFGLVMLLLFFTVPLWYSKFLQDQERYIVRGAIAAVMIGSLANSWLLDVTQGYFYAYFVAIMFAQKLRFEK